MSVSSSLLTSSLVSTRRLSIPLFSYTILGFLRSGNTSSVFSFGSYHLYDFLLEGNFKPLASLLVGVSNCWTWQFVSFQNVYSNKVGSLQVDICDDILSVRTISVLTSRVKLPHILYASHFGLMEPLCSKPFILGSILLSCFLCLWHLQFKYNFNHTSAAVRLGYYV